MTLRRSWPFFVGILSTVSTVVAQPAATETKPAAAATPPAASAPATSAPAATTPAAPAADAKPADTKPAVEPSPQQKEFDKRLKEWNDLREKLGTLQIDYKSAKPEERAPIVEKFKQTLVEGEKLQPTIIAAAEAAFAADAKSEGPANFLAALAQNFYAADRYEESLKTSEALIRGNFSNKRIYNLAGKAAFNLCDFDKAEKYLKQGQEASALDARGDRYLVLAPLYKPLWAKEQELRAAEAKSDLPRVQLKTTQGDITLELFENEAPQTVGNFVNLVEKGFYDGLSFHRVIAEFMAQGGDPKGDGTGGPGYDIPCECYKPERRLHFRGTLSMAHAGKDTGGSQFFITFLPTSNLDGAAVDAKNTGTPHTVFGRVIEGLDVLAKLQRREPPGPHSFDRSASPPGDKILSAKVLRKRNHPYEPTKVGPPPAAKTDAPKTEPAKTEPAKTDAPKSEAPKTEAPKSDAPKAEAPKTDAPKTDAPKKDVPTLEPPKSDAPKTDAPKSDAPKTEPKP